MSTIKERFDALKAELLASECPDRKAELFNELQELMISGGEEAAEAYRQSLDADIKKAEEVSMRQSIEFVLKCLSVAFVAREYFGKSQSWLYQRINGNIVNGSPAKFTPEEKKKLKDALRDISDRILEAVDKI